MFRRTGWLAAALVLGVLLWQTIAADGVIPRPAAAILLAAASGMAGLRIATDAAAAYVQDLQRLNKYLAGQNGELEKANEILLSQLSQEVETSSNRL